MIESMIYRYTEIIKKDNWGTTFTFPTVSTSALAEVGPIVYLRRTQRPLAHVDINVNGTTACRTRISTGVEREILHLPHPICADSITLKLRHCSAKAVHLCALVTDPVFSNSRGE